MHQADHQLHRDVYGHTIRDRTGDGLSSWGTNRQGIHSYVQAHMESHLRQLQPVHMMRIPTALGEDPVSAYSRQHCQQLLTSSSLSFVCIHPAFFLVST